MLLPTLQTAGATSKDLALSFGPAGTAYRAVITAEPFRLDVYAGTEKVISLNDRNLLKFEELRERDAAQPAGVPKPNQDEAAST